MMGSILDPAIHYLGALYKLLSFPEPVSSPVQWVTLVSICIQGVVGKI